MQVRISRHWTLLAAVLFGLLLLIYSRSLWNDFVLWDDDYLIVHNPLIRSLSPHAIWTAFTSYDPELYIPLTFLSYQLNYLIGGLHPFIYHVTNLLLHGINAMLISGIAYRLSNKNTWIAVAAGILFAVHPLHAEAVVWASARKDVLASTFFLTSLFLYLRYRESDQRSTCIWSIVTFLLALLSKVSVITLPIILLLIDWREGRRWDKQMLMEKLPYALLSILFGTVALFGKTQQIAHTTIRETVLLTMKSLAFTLEKLFVPLHLSPMYPFTGDITLSSSQFFVPMILLLILAATSIYSRRWTRELLFALLFFLFSIAPSMVNFRKGEEGDIYLASDRYAYIASFAAIFLVCMLLYRLGKKFSPLASNGILAITVITLASLSFVQADIWHDSETLFTTVIASYPQAQAAHHNLGVLYQKEGHMQQALDQYQAALAIAPKASTLSNIGDILRENNQFPEAAEFYKQALAINPRSVDAMLGMGLLALQQSDVKTAIAAFQTAVEFAPGDSRTHLNLGAALLRAQRTDEAITEYKKAITFDPTNAAAFFNLAVALERVGRITEAKESYARAVELDSTFAAAAGTLQKQQP